MNKYFTTLTNERGDVLPNYRAQVTDSLGAVVEIYADKGGTRFRDASGNVINYATASANGMVAFYFEAATGQILQTLDAAGNLVDSEADFADNLVLENLPGNIAQSAVVGLESDLGNKASTADLASADAAKGVALVAGAGRIASTRAVMKALSGNGNLSRPVHLTEAGREGVFAFDSSNLSSQVAADSLEGVYVAPDSDATGASGAWVRQWTGLKPDPRWFGAVADGVLTTSGTPLFLPLSVAGTDSAPAVLACIAVCGGAYLQGGNYVFASRVTVSDLEYLECPATGSAQIFAANSFTDSEVILLTGTRTTCKGIQVIIPTSVYDGATDTGTQVSGIRTTGQIFHEYIRDCRVRGGYHGFHLTGLEGSLTKCVGDLNYNGFYCETYDGSQGGYDNSLTNCTSTGAYNFGCYSERGLEATDLHLVESKRAALRLSGQVPVMIRGLFVDTPLRDGIWMTDIRGGMFDGVFFTKVAEGRTFDGGATTNTGTTPDWESFYFRLERCRDNRFTGGSIYISEIINTAQVHFVALDDGVTWTNVDRSIRNTFENFRSQNIDITKDATQRTYATWQRWVNNSGALSRYNNEGYIYRGTGTALNSAASTTIRVYLPEIDRSDVSEFAAMQFEYTTRQGNANRSAGLGVIPLARTSDTGSKDGVFQAPIYTVGTPPTFSITAVTPGSATAGANITRWVDYTITNTSGTTATLAHAVRPPLDNISPT